jgi:hypothetical protein
MKYDLLFRWFVGIGVDDAAWDHSVFSKNRRMLHRTPAAAALRLTGERPGTAVGSDLQNPRVEGKRTAQVRFVNWYIARFFQAAQHDGILATKFLEVANLMQQPTALLSFGVALRVWKRNRLPVGA